MANKKTPRKQTTLEKSTARRTRILQIIFVAFSIILILSMLLSLTQY